jgi:hypothetical protein
MIIDTTYPSDREPITVLFGKELLRTGLQCYRNGSLTTEDLADVYSPFCEPDFRQDNGFLYQEIERSFYALSAISKPMDRLFRNSDPSEPFGSDESGPTPMEAG